ncbi:enoyl-CoA hydratase/isomerase family protein [Streptomyces sp. M10(2022)]
MDGKEDVPLRARLDGGVATLTLDRPHRRNSLDLTLSRHLLLGLLCAGTIRGFARSSSPETAGPSARATMSRACGDGGWATAATPVRPHHLGRSLSAGLRGDPAPPQTRGGGSDRRRGGRGAEIACAADFRLADTRASIGSCLAGVGHVGNVVLMSRLTGPARATEIYLTGRMVSGTEAVHLGLFDRLCEPADFDRELAALTDRFAALPTASVGLFKELRERSWGSPPSTGCGFRTPTTSRPTPLWPTPARAWPRSRRSGRPASPGLTGAGACPVTSFAVPWGSVVAANGAASGPRPGPRPFAATTERVF